MPVPLVASTQGRDLFEARAGGFHYRVTEYHGGLSLPHHRHEHAKMSTALRGGYTETFARAGRFECDARTLLMKPPDISHSDSYLGPDTLCLTVDIEPEALELVRTISPLFRSPREARFRSPLITRIMSELEKPDSVSSFMLEALAMELIAQVTRRDGTRVEASTAFRRACEFLDAHLGSSIRFADVAAAAGIPPALLARLFETHAGCSPGLWLRRRRIDASKEALRTQATIAEIALAFGFYDQSHFNNAFRRATGTTPAQFRRELRRG